jgi:hypothetical protein
MASKRVEKGIFSLFIVRIVSKIAQNAKHKPKLTFYVPGFSFGI